MIKKIYSVNRDNLSLECDVPNHRNWCSTAGNSADQADIRHVFDQPTLEALYRRNLRVSQLLKKSKRCWAWWKSL